MKSRKYISNKKPWPTKEAMEQVYELNLWGGDSDFYSGDGSYDDTIVKPYINSVLKFLNSFDHTFNIVDLGCGDFNIGSQLLNFSNNYIAIDIAESLITRNKKKFKSKKLSFHCLDIAKDILPKGDCAILRQVLQHLSNKEVQRIIPKLFKYKYVLLTEHIPDGKFHPNIDIISGQGIRLKKNSGLDLFSPPFNLKVKKVTELVSVPVKKWKGRIVTNLLEMY
tara:strand:- start:3350 stop:4018 length:669 start_codon:yes stop_codon:yes gene_type:complete